MHQKKQDGGKFAKSHPHETPLFYSVHTPAGYTQAAHESIHASREQSIEPASWCQLPFLVVAIRARLKVKQQR